MENSGKVFFDDDSAQWYVALGERWIGPLAASDVYRKIMGQELSWAHYVWKPGQAGWQRICEVKSFQAAVPAAPPKTIQVQVKDASQPGLRKKAPPPPPKDEQQKPWFLYFNDTQYGPFSTEEVSRFLRIGKLHGRVHIWREGMTGWDRLENIERFSEDVAESKLAREAKKAQKAAAPPVPLKSAAAKASVQGLTQVQEQRNAPRHPIVAKILMANQEKLVAAICRDISVGGMQVLTDHVPGPAGTRIKLNVSPGKGGKGSKSLDKTIEPFVAEGVIVRVLDDGRGFSFRFEKLPESSRKSIERYIKAV